VNTDSCTRGTRSSSSSSSSSGSASPSMGYPVWLQRLFQPSQYLEFNTIIIPILIKRCKHVLVALICVVLWSGLQPLGACWADRAAAVVASGWLQFRSQATKITVVYILHLINIISEKNAAVSAHQRNHVRGATRERRGTYKSRLLYVVFAWYIRPDTCLSRPRP
jgi:hypothetical protein